MALSIDEALPRVVDSDRIRPAPACALIAAGKLPTPARVARALATGADFVNTARAASRSRSAASRPRAATATPADRHHDAQPAFAARLPIVADSERVAAYRVQHEQGNRHDRPLPGLKRA